MGKSSENGIPVPDLAEIRAEVARAIREHCPRGLASRADDLAQDVLVKVLERARQSEGEPVRHSSYWRRAAYHALIDEIRRQRRRREESLDHDSAGDSWAAPAHHDPARRALGREVGAAIEECLAGVREGRRLPVFLHLQGHSVPEASTLLGWATKRTESALFRGLQDLRACLRSKGFGR